MKKILIILTILLSGCSANWYLDKAIKKNPDIIQRDTVVSRDTVWREVAVVDTVVNFSYDTVQIELPGEVFVKYRVDTVEKRIEFQVDCPDCPEVTETVTLPQVVKEPTFINFFWRYWWLLVVVFFVGFFTRNK